jgi:hypothetical protein
MIKGAGGNREGGPNLQTAAAGWPTPNAGTFNDGEAPEDFERRKVKHQARGIRNGEPLAIAVQKMGAGGIAPGYWPTTAARDFKGANSAEHVTTNGSGRMHMDQLPNFVEHCFSPRAQPIAPGQRSLRPIPFSPPPSGKSISGPLLDAILEFRRYSMRSGGAAGWHGIWIRQPRRKLNQRFTELLMGWPIGWTRCEPAETGFFLWLQASRGYLSSLSSPRPPDQMSLL